MERTSRKYFRTDNQKNGKSHAKHFKIPRDFGFPFLKFQILVFSVKRKQDFFIYYNVLSEKKVKFEPN